MHCLPYTSAKKAILLAGLHGNSAGYILYFVGQILDNSIELLFPLGYLPPFVIELFHAPATRFDGQCLGNQEISGVTLANINDLALLSDFINSVTKNDLH